MRSVRGGEGLPERAGGALLPFSRSGLPCPPHSDSAAAVVLHSSSGFSISDRAAALVARKAKLVRICEPNPKIGTVRLRPYVETRNFRSLFPRSRVVTRVVLIRRSIRVQLLAARNAALQIMVYELFFKFPPAACLKPARFPIPIRSGRCAYHSDALQCKRHACIDG